MAKLSASALSVACDSKKLAWAVRRPAWSAELALRYLTPSRKRLIDFSRPDPARITTLWGTLGEASLAARAFAAEWELHALNRQAFSTDAAEDGSSGGAVAAFYRDALERAARAEAAHYKPSSLGRRTSCRRPLSHNQWLIARHSGALAAYAAVTACFSLEFGGPFALLDEIFVLPEHRGHGLLRLRLPIFGQEGQKISPRRGVLGQVFIPVKPVIPDG